jgi:riboflavin kinase/FMN adenylyltransferase
MTIWNGIARRPRGKRPVVASIGNYDGLHLGHQAILRKVVNHARACELPSMLITFEPHPVAVVAPERRPRLLQSRRQKLDQLEPLGLTELLILEFNKSLAKMNGEEFFERVLARHIEFAAIHVGENFRFGHERSGDVELLRRIGTQRGFDVSGMPAVEIDGESVSSSKIRRAVELGEVERARRMLGRCFSVAGEVIHGAGRGKELEFPTANVEIENEIVPRSGVYVTQTLALASRYESVTNVGIRPTFGGRELTVESHLFDFSDELYGERVEVCFLARVRDEMQFDSGVELADQIARDRAAAEAYFRNLPLGQR